MAINVGDLMLAPDGKLWVVYGIAPGGVFHLQHYDAKKRRFVRKTVVKS